MPDMTETMDRFRRICGQAAEIAERFGLGVSMSDRLLVVYATSPHMGGCTNTALPPNAQHYFTVNVDESGNSRVSWWPHPVISNLGTIKLAVLGHISSAEPLYEKYKNLSDFDPDRFADEFAKVTERVVNKINKFERQLDAKDQSDAVESIKSSSENLRSAIDGTIPRLEETLYPCAGPEYT